MRCGGCISIQKQIICQFVVFGIFFGIWNFLRKMAYNLWYLVFFFFFFCVQCLMDTSQVDLGIINRLVWENFGEEMKEPWRLLPLYLICSLWKDHNRRCIQVVESVKIGVGAKKTSLLILFSFHLIGSPNLTVNVFKTGPVIELEKLLVHDSLVRPAVEPRSNR